MSAKFFGPFPILAKIGALTYKLHLPDECKIHPVFHVSKLKQHEAGEIVVVPITVLDRKLGKLGHKADSQQARAIVNRLSRGGHMGTLLLH